MLAFASTLVSISPDTFSPFSTVVLFFISALVVSFNILVLNEPPTAVLNEEFSPFAIPTPTATFTILRVLFANTFNALA